jgi:hypothetical protein
VKDGPIVQQDINLPAEVVRETKVGVVSCDSEMVNLCVAGGVAAPDVRWIAQSSAGSKGVPD